MKIKREALKAHIKEKFRNNQTWFAEEIAVDRHYFNRVLNGREKATSPKICNNIIEYCKRNDLDYRSFISLE